VGDPVTATVLLRAERESDGRRTFRLMPGRSLPTSYGPDLLRPHPRSSRRTTRTATERP
jgi:hypothetical protein